MTDPRAEADLGRSPGPESRPAGHPIFAGLIGMARAYRVLSLGMFAFAVLHLARLGDSESYFLLFLVVFPFSMALAISYRVPGPPNRWIVAFLLLVDLGVIIAPEHRILPMLHHFWAIPETQSRILTWYFLVYATLQFGILPPVAFARSLRTARGGGRPTLGPWVCVFGLGAWGLVASLLTFSLIRSWR